VKNKIYPTDLTDSQWNHIKEMIPKEEKRGRPRELEMRAVVNAIFYVVHGGIQWRMMPKEYPNWSSVYYYFLKWTKNGIWKQIHDILRAKMRQKEGRHKHPTAGSIDSQSVKGSLVPGVRGYVLVDTLGFVLAAKVTPASVQDRDGARQLLVSLPGHCKCLRKIWVDAAYRGNLVDWVAEKFKFRLDVVTRDKDQPGFHVLPRRWVVERTFGWLNGQRRLSKDYERLQETSEVFIYISMSRLMLKRLA
jgi:putative transposase